MGIKSVLTTQKGICYLCQAHGHTHMHHIIHTGVSKKTQERMGLICYLCFECHEGAEGVHGSFGAEKDQDLKKIAQKMWEEKYMESYPYQNHAQEAAREEWMRQIRKSYL